MRMVSHISDLLLGVGIAGLFQLVTAAETRGFMVAL